MPGRRSKADERVFLNVPYDLSYERTLGGNPSTLEVLRLYRRMMRYIPALKARHGKRDLYGTRVYGELVALGWESAAELRL